MAVKGYLFAVKIFFNLIFNEVQNGQIPFNKGRVPDA